MASSNPLRYDFHGDFGRFKLLVNNKAKRKVKITPYKQDVGGSSPSLPTTS